MPSINSKNQKIKLRRLALAFSFFAAACIFGCGASASTAIAMAEAEAAAKESIAFCQDAVGCVPAGTSFDCSKGILSLLKCVQMESTNNASLQNSSQWTEYAKRIADLAAKEAKKEALAIAFKTSLSTFARQVAHDTAVWVASGGRGQKPLFITEGWGAYLENAADAALGDFISKVGTVYGVNLCQPNLQIRLAIQQGLDYRRQYSRSCSLSTMANNWQKSISNANFALDYRTAMGAGENDITYMMMLGDQRDLAVSGSVNAKAKEAETNSLWKDIKNVADVVLTPGTFIKKQFFDSQDSANASIGYSTFTGTVADVIEEFLNTLVAQLLKQLQSGFFAGSGGGTGNSQNINAVDLSSLFNSNSSPALGSGAASAKLLYSSLISGQTKTGSKIDILLKLSQCSEQAKSNPGPTDCVIDSVMQSAIKNKKYLIDLPDSVKNRIFAPKINQTASLDSVIPSRSITILRKYSIVPVGWELAAQIAATLDRDVTLQQVMDCYYPGSANCIDSRFNNLIDPYWVLKAPEEFCRKIGYSGRNTMKSDQSGAISRNQECVDEQQCLAEDDQGNCKSYGYCTEQRRTWDMGKSCQAKYNTCSSFTSRLGDKGNWLANTLDFGICSAQNAGCRSYATDYNYQSSAWNGEFIEGGQIKKYSIAAENVDIAAVYGSDDWLVPAASSTSKNGRLKISQPCSPDLCVGGYDVSGCVWQNSSKSCVFARPGNATYCSVPKGGFSCIVNSCFDLAANLLAADNPSIISYVDADNSNAKFWTDEMSVLSGVDRHYRSEAAADKRGASDSLKLVSAGNESQLITTLPNIPVDSAGKYYLLKFYAKGNAAMGGVTISVYGGSASLYSDYPPSSLTNISSLPKRIDGWQEYSLYFNSYGVSTATIAIITTAGSITNYNVTDFRLYRMTDKCQKNTVQLFTPAVPVAASRIDSNIYFNRNVSTCSSADTGCSQFIRLKAGLGSNVLANGGFEYATNDMPTEWSSSGGVMRLSSSNEPVRFGTYSLVLANGMAVLPSANIPVELAAGKKYALSGFVYSPNANSALRADVIDARGNSLGGAGVEVVAGDIKTWKRFQAVFDVNSNVESYSIRLSNQDGNIVFYDDIKFEQLAYDDANASAYSAYDPSDRPASQVSYLKKAPNSFNCYLTASKAWPKTAAEAADVAANRSPACSAYSPVCAKDEVGCELYAPTNGDPAVPGVATDLDLCPGECIGYKIYKQEKSDFATSTYRQFIADSKTKYCSAAYAGCDEFTNLDNAGNGGEKREYYTRIKACQKPSTDDASYYTWEGSDTVGYQLKAYNLKKSDILDNNNGGFGYAPCTNLTYDLASFEGQPKCQERTLGPSGACAKADMLSNDDCREFYDTAGNIHTRLASLTVTVSDNCHPYRRTQTQTVINEAKNDCRSSHGYWNSNNECIYMAIPSEGGVCSAAAKGCREYTGNTGNNVRNVISALNFSTTLNNLSWRDANDKTDGLFISSESTFTGGSSLSNKPGYNTLKYPVVIQKNKAYTVSFWAKGNRSFFVQSIAFKNSPGEDYFARSSVSGGVITQSAAKITADWNKFDLGPVFISWDPGESSEFVITLSSGDQIYLDNLVLKELNDSIYAVENSWYTPQSCDNKLNDANGAKAIAADSCEDKNAGRCSPGEMLGCSSYKDRSGTARNFRSFTSLCRREAAGCEALIDTANSNSPYDAVFNPGVDNDISKVTVPKDSLAYLVNDSAYACSSSAKGCRALGLPSVDGWNQIASYSTLFLINDPEKYTTDLCRHGELWCEEYNKDNSGLVYFKNPGNKTCDYNPTDRKWYKTGTTIECPTSANMTIGTGYDPVVSKSQPQGPYDNAISATSLSPSYQGFVGNCPASEATCSEYIDPYSEIYPNLIPDKLSGKASGKISVKANAMYYIIGVKIDAQIPGGCGVYPSFFGKNLYYLSYPDKQSCDIVISKESGALINTKPAAGSDVSDKVAYAGVYYAKSATVDSSSCNGMVNYKDGCILVNSRSSMDFSTSSASGRYQKNLVYDSRTTYENNLRSQLEPVSVVPAVANKAADVLSADSNIIVKASPNRTCAKWLACTTYQKTEDSTQSFRFDNSDKCLNIGVCSATDDNGNCIQYEQSGYEKLSVETVKPGTSGFAVPGYLPLDQMDQWGNSANVPNGNFESVMGKTAEPVGWNITASSSDLNNDGWKSYKYAVENKQQYLKFDSGYLKISGVYAVDSDPIDIEEGKYVLDAWINTLQLSPSNAKAVILVSADNLDKVFLGKAGDDVKTVRMEGRLWKTYDGLQVDAGNGWTQKTVIVDSRGTNTIRLRLINLNDAISNNFNYDDNSAENRRRSPNYFNCYDVLKIGTPNYATDCQLSGSSDGGTLFDNISLRSALRVKGLVAGDNPAVNELVGRNCRAYPAQDAKSCQYYQDGKFYYGWYGYCLVEDQKNSGQCLQWYPVDELKGDVVDEYSAGYNDRMPLYYCIGAIKNVMTAAIQSGSFGVGTGLDGLLTKAVPGLSSAMSSVVGDKGKTIQFTLSNPAAARLFRYPMILRFGVRSYALGGGAVSNSLFGVGMMYYSGTMEKSKSCFNIASPGASCPERAVVGSVVTTLAGYLQPLMNGLSIDLNALLGIGSGVSKNSEWGGWGVVVPAAFSGIGIGLPIASWDQVEQKIMDAGSDLSTVFNASFGSERLVADGSVLGAKIVLDSDQKYANKFVDPNPGIKGDILGVIWGLVPGKFSGGFGQISVTGDMDTYYCSKIVEVVTSMGQNKSWTNRVAQGSQFNFSSSDKVDPWFSDPYGLTTQTYDDIDKNNLGFKLDGYDSDYKPYGAIVAPSENSQNPALWDSYINPNSTDLSRQPLYWEPPVLSQSAPYQPRMGQPILSESLKFLFAKAYRSWTWQADANRPSGTSDDYAGSYRLDSGPSAWTLPSAYCPASMMDAYRANSYVRSVNDRTNYCLIAPEISTIKINSSTANTAISAALPVKLDFTVRVDRDQLPLTSYSVDWGDGERYITSIAGVKLRDRATSTNPFTLYHLYDFEKLRAQNNSQVSCNAQSCLVRILIKATDNWRATGTAMSVQSVEIKQD